MDRYLQVESSDAGSQGHSVSGDESNVKKKLEGFVKTDKYRCGTAKWTCRCQRGAIIAPARVGVLSALAALSALRAMPASLASLALAAKRSPRVATRGLWAMDQILTGMNQ
jgi:hypothetical protein